MPKFPRFILKYFLRGVLYTVPLAIILYILFFLVQSIDGLMFDQTEDVVLELNNGQEIILEDVRLAKDGGGIGYIPGLGVLVLIVIITGIGYAASTILAQPIINWFQRLLDRAPLIKTIYTSIKDLITAFVGKKKGFDQPVLVRLSQEMEVSKLGFITQTDLQKLGISDEMIAVYLPHSFNFSGNLFVVPERNVQPIDVKSSNLMKFIVSGGVADIDPDEGSSQKDDDL